MADNVYYMRDGQRVRVVRHAWEVENPTDEVFDRKIHKGLINEEGQKVHFVKGTPSTHGELGKGWGPMVKKTGERKKKTTERSQEIVPRYDDTLGARFHISTGAFSDLYNDAASPYFRDENRRLRLRNPEFKNMRPINVGGMKDTFDAASKIGIERLEKSIALGPAAVVPMTEFFGYYANPDSYRDLVRRLEENEGPQLCVTQIKLLHPAIPSPDKWKNMSVNSPEIAWPAHDDRRKGRIIPSMFLPYWVMTSHGHRYRNNQQRAFMVPGDYYILGYATLKKLEHEYSDTYYINMRVTDAEQIVYGNDAIEGMFKVLSERRLPQDAGKSQNSGIAPQI